MRAAALAALVLVLAGCGSSGAATSAGGNDAASLVPADAKAFAVVRPNASPAAWQAVRELAGPKLKLEQLSAAVGDSVSVAVLGDEAVALAQPQDDAKLRAFAAKFDQGSDHYTVQHVGDWSVVADSQKLFDRVRAAKSGSSLADDASFQAARKTFTGKELATAFVKGTTVPTLGAAKWLAARLTGDASALRLDLHAEAPQHPLAAYRPTLLHDVPSGAIATVSFKDLDRASGRLQGFPLAQLLPSLRGEGALYVLQTPLVPTLVVEIQSPDPQAAKKALEKIGHRLSARLGNLVSLRVVRFGSRVVLTNAPASFHPGGGALTNDQPFKDASAAADVPQEVTWLAYADIQRLKPFLQLLNIDSQRVERLDTLLAYGTPSGLTARASLR